MKEYRLYQSNDGKWIMEEYEDKEMTTAVMGDSRANCLDQLFHKDVVDLNMQFAQSCGVIFA